MMRALAMTLLLLTLTASSLSAADPAHPATAPDSVPHPQVPEHPTWVGKTLVSIAVLFALAILVGPIVALYRRPEPVVMGHDDHSHSHEAHEHTSAGLDKHAAHDPHAGHGGHH